MIEHDVDVASRSQPKSSSSAREDGIFAKARPVGRRCGALAALSCFWAFYSGIRLQIYSNPCRVETVMSALPSLMRLVALLIFLSAVNGPASAAAAVGTVTRVQNQAQIGATAATVGAPVHMNDQLLTGSNARLQVTFRDGTTLTLGENAKVVVDRYVYNPEQSTGDLALNATRGAIRLATGRLHQMRDRDVKVSTPYAALAVRGTEFWTGPIDGHYGALLLKGRVSVSNRAGAVTLSVPGQGTDIQRRR